MALNSSKSRFAIFSAWSLVVNRAHIVGNQSERSKDNRGIVFWVRCLISIEKTSSLFT